ncbi:uncharacterized protein TNCV_1769731 [Trichonephila clavipes]|nr:uncharacterized protein TNCV_1769731 [Trichonephila clavipes]
MSRKDIFAGSRFWIKKKPRVLKKKQLSLENLRNKVSTAMVIKLSRSTTLICPVFDASAKLANYLSLNQCLACGSNLIEPLPDILLRLREREFGVIADIRKAFLQINIREEDRDFLRFL